MTPQLYKSPVVFREDDHTYWLGEKQLKGVTSTLIHLAFPDKYKDVDPAVLANAARMGHELHEKIEFHDTFGSNAEEHGDERIANYERLKSEHGLRTIANEYLVSDEETYASSVDIVMLNKDDEICLVDTKTTYNLDKQSVALQLSIYKRFFEHQNHGLKVKKLYALWLPNKDHTIAELHEVAPVKDSIIDSLIEKDLAGETFDVTTTYGDLPARLHDVEDEIVRLEAQLHEFKEREDELKKGLYNLMMTKDVKSFTGEKIRLTRVLPTTSETFDTKRFKTEHPDIYKEYVKTTEKSGSLRITIL